jgi:hypothetical protein
MPQPPITPVQARELVRAVPFAAQRTYAGAAGLAPLVIAPAGVIQVQWDIADGITDVSQLLLGNYPGAGGAAVPLPHATGPFLDAAAYSVPTVAGEAGLLTVEYAIDRGCLFRLVTPGTAVPANTFVNISGLRITGRFVRVTLGNPATNTNNLTVEFGVYVRST